MFDKYIIFWVRRCYISNEWVNLNRFLGLKIEKNRLNIGIFFYSPRIVCCGMAGRKGWGNGMRKKEGRFSCHLYFSLSLIISLLPVYCQCPLSLFNPPPSPNTYKVLK